MPRAATCSGFSSRHGSSPNAFTSSGFCTSTGWTPESVCCVSGADCSGGGVDAGSPPPWEQADRPSTAADDTAISRRDSTSSSLDLTGYSGFVGVLVVAESCFQLLDLVGEALDAFIYGVAEASRVVMGPPGQLVGHLLADLVLPRGGN